MKKKRIDETLDKGYVIESSGRLDEDEIEGIKFLIEEYRKALNIYKALIIKVDEICHGHLPFTTMRMTQAVQDLEEKFYPKPKTTKEKLDKILNEHFVIAHKGCKIDIGRLQEDLCKLYNEIDDD